MEFSLREAFSGLIAYTLLFARSPAEQQRSFEEVRQKTLALLKDQQDAIRQHQIPSADYDNARFAVVAWVDEVIVRCTRESNLALCSRWGQEPLQKRIYDRTTGGDEFFRRLDQLRQAQAEHPTMPQKEVHEIYYLCLCLGFRGRYTQSAQDWELDDLRRQSAKFLPTPLADLYDFEKEEAKISPELYGIQTTVATRPRRLLTTRRMMALSGALAAVSLLALVAISVVFIRQLLRQIALQTGEVQRTLETFPCSDLRADRKKGVFQITGRFASPEQKQAVQTALDGIPGVKTKFDDPPRIVRWPFCEVMGLLAGYQRPEGNGGVHFRRGCDSTYYPNNDFSMELLAPKGSTVYVDYYGADHQTVVHLDSEPVAAAPPGSAQSGEQLLRSPSKKHPRQIKANPEVGEEMVAAIAGPPQLFNPPRPGVDSAKSYLAALRQSLHAGDASQEAATFCSVFTKLGKP